jgi:hypothetical protein
MYSYELLDSKQTKQMNHPLQACRLQSHLHVGVLAADDTYYMNSIIS